MYKPKHEQLSRHAQRQIDGAGRASGMEYVANRLDVLKAAKGFIEEDLGAEEFDVMDILAVAEFLTGDRIHE